MERDAVEPGPGGERAGWRLAVVAGPVVLALAAFPFVPPVSQSQSYHVFADQRTFFGVPNFWNVASNAAFLLVAMWGLTAFRSPSAFLEKWERVAYGALVAATAAVAIGSGYYHARPGDGTLFWDRLPMTVVFMALLAITIGERISPRAGRVLLAPLILLGAAAVFYWRFSGDLRLYGVVEYYPMIALPSMLILFRPRYSGTAGIVLMFVFYVIAKLLETGDRQLAAVVATGGHPWKHVAAAMALLCYVEAVRRRRPIGSTR